MWTETSAETEPPKEKRAKRQRDDVEELEDGELTDSSDGEGEEPEGDGEGVACHQSPAGDAEDDKEALEDSCCWGR